MKSTKLFYITILAVAFEVCSFGQTNRSIAPGGLGLEVRNGNTGDDILRSSAGERSQLFASTVLPWSEPVAISAMSFRLENDVPAASVIIPRIEIRLSTSIRSPDNMSMLYADNVGGDEKLVFGQNDVVLASAGGPGPNPFDLTFRFAQPFLYNPHNGNLLFRLNVSDGDIFGSRTIDAEQGGTGYKLVAPNIFSVPISQAIITEFSWSAIPEPRISVFLGSAGILFAALKRKRNLG